MTGSCGRRSSSSRRAVSDTLLGRLDGEGRLVLDEIRIDDAELRRVDKIVIVACGTAFYAGMVAEVRHRALDARACEVEIASEFRYRDPIITPTTLVVTISQSGETATRSWHPACAGAAREGHRDLQHERRDIPRESDAVIYTHAGPEIGVASTKGFTTQIVACYLLGL